MRLRIPRTFGVALVCAAAATLWAPAALADEEAWEGGYKVHSKRRSDFTAGASAGLLILGGRGYPNDAGQIDNPRHVADPGIAPGFTYTAWIGGALRDWFTFGIGFTSLSASGGGYDATGTGFLFRVETFPFFAEGGAWEDIGAYGNFGLGALKLERDGESKADAGAMSIVAFGAFYEPLRFSIFSFGPSVEYQHLFSRSLRMFGATAALRLVLYTGP